MTAQTPAQRKAAERQRKADAGMTRLELFAHPEDHAAIKAHAAKLQRKRSSKNLPTSRAAGTKAAGKNVA